MPNLSLLFVTYNSAGVIGDVLAPLAGHEKDFACLVVDNASSDTTVSFIQEEFPWVRVIRQEKNIGYGRGANVWLEQAKDDYVLLLNPDLLVAPEDILTLVECLKADNNLALIAPVTEEEEFHHLQEPLVKKQPWVCGAAMLFDMKKMRQVGFFDPAFFLFYEETDLCKRIIKQGFEIGLAEHIFFHHKKGMSSMPSPRILYLKSWHSSWSKLHFMRKYERPLRTFRKVLSTLVGSACRSLIYRLRGNQEKYLQNKAKSAGGLAFLLGLSSCKKNGQPRGLN